MRLLLLIAAVALPYWQPMTAQEMARSGDKFPDVSIKKQKEVRNDVSVVERREKNATSVEKFPAALTNAKVSAKVDPMSDEPKGAVTKSQQSDVKQSSDVKTMKTRRGTTAHSTKAVRNVNLRAVDVPDGYALVKLTVGDLWGDGSGYQMLLDQNATMYASWSSNGITQSLYDMAEYKIPENADYNANGNSSNFLFNATGQVLVPAGTYDILILNPTPGDKIYAASENGNIGGRIDDYALASGMVYEFTTSLGGTNDRTDVSVTNSAGESAIVCDGTASNNYVPVYGLYVDTQGCESQMIYPSSKITAAGLNVGDEINAITFYVTSQQATVPDKLGYATVQVRIGEITSTTIADANTMRDNRTSLTQVYSNTLPTGDSKMTITFSQPYTYNGGNLIVDTYVSAPNGSNYSRCSWAGETATSGSSFYVSSSSNNGEAQQFLPKMKIDFTTPSITARDIVVNDAEFFEGKTYTWVDDNGNTQTSNLAETATTPKQMIAMFKKIYTDPTIPGNLKRGFDERGRNEPWNDCYYTGVGRIGGSGSVANASSYYYSDRYGWNIPGDLVFNNSLSSSNIYYTHMDTTQYRPNQEGLTLILVEIKDDFNKDDLDGVSWSDLETYFAKTLKSARIITEARRTGDGLDAGTLFKIDCDKMNKFFLLAKGQLCWKNNSYYAETDELVPGSTDNYYILTREFCGPPAYIFYRYRGYDYQYHYVNQFCDYFSQPLFYHMFEQFSPNAFGENAKDDLYQLMLGEEMKSFGVVHDCASVEPIQGHGFMMYGAESDAADCQDIRDMMFFIPDYRMMKDATRDNGKNYKFSYYNLDHQPTMGVYVIRQDEITPTTAADDYYMLDLNWRTNLDDFLPGEDQEFELLQVVVNEETGLEEYVPVYYMNENGEYTDAEGNVVETPVPIVLHLGPGAEKNYPSVYVQRQSSSQQVTYAIRGRDTGHFLSLQISNRQSYIIPGKDPTELVSLIELSHYSRYNAQSEKNCYSNRFKMSNNVGGLTRENMSDPQNSQNENVFTFTRKTSSTDANPVTIATATVTNRTTDGGTITIAMQNQADETEYPEAKSGSGYAGYHANPGEPWESTFTYNTVNGKAYVNFGDLVLCDNFTVDVSNNEHPNQYIYEVNFNLVPNSEHDFTEAHGSAFRVPIYKTASKINKAYSLIEVKGDKDHAIEANEDLTFSERVQYSSKTEILRYDVYRWLNGDNANWGYIVDEVGDNDAEQDLSPDGIAGNQGEGYTVTMNDVNGDYYYNGGTVAVSSGTAWADFVDYYPKAINNAASYTYAPVVETFTVGKNAAGTVRTDYNTYGGPQQLTAVGLLDINTPQYDISDYSWLENGDRYAYYTVELPVETDLVPDGYKIYMVRAWRVVEPSLLGEKLDAFAYRKTATGEYLFEEMLGPNEEDGEYQPGTHQILGAATIPNAQDVSGNNIPVCRGTFGARKVLTQGGNNDGCLTDGLPMTFRVRLYFTPDTESASGAPAAGGVAPKAESTDKKYYVAEYTTQFTIPSGIPTGIENLNANQVVGVKYYNAAGVESDKPFKGVNIVVTRYSDGSTTTTKVLK